MLEEARNWEKTGPKRDCPHGQHLSKNEQGPPKKQMKIESIFVVQNLFNDHLYHFCGAVVVVKTIVIGSSN